MSATESKEQAPTGGKRLKLHIKSGGAFTDEKKKLKVCIAGGAGFIGSHLARRLMAEGHTVVCADWAKCEYFKNEEFCHTFHHLDLRVLENCKKATEGCDWVFNLAADMGGMGFIQSNNSVILYNNTMLSLNVIEAARFSKCSRYFYSSSACVYPEHIQEIATCTALKEDDCWPAAPQDAYGLEKLYAEEIAISYGADFGFETRVARFHNIYGDHATWKGGREKAPAAFCRKIAAGKTGDEVSMWGDGKQTRSFCHVDDCVEGILRLMRSDLRVPINLGSDEMVTMNEMLNLCMTFEDKKLTIKHIPGPEGVRGRNSDNDFIKEQLGWAPSILLKDGLKRTYDWINSEIQAERAQGINKDYLGSTVVKQSVESLENLGQTHEKLTKEDE